MTEDEYVEDERRHFAWIMQHHSEITPAEAEAATLERYPALG
ncbi:hypothetical protein [Amycolatopsis circi]|nr:hypothetical protein [Amycolatopsis circi]